MSCIACASSRRSGVKRNAWKGGAKLTMGLGGVPIQDTRLCCPGAWCKCVAGCFDVSCMVSRWVCPCAVPDGMASSRTCKRSAMSSGATHLSTTHYHPSSGREEENASSYLQCRQIAVGRLRERARGRVKKDDSSKLNLVTKQPR